MLSKKPLSQQPVDRLLNLSTTPNPMHNNQMLSVGALEEINRLKQPSPIIPSATPPQATPQPNVIRNASLQTMPQKPVSSEDDTNFLGSLIAQGVAGIGTGLMGGSPRDILNSANMFQYMRDQQTKRNKSDLLMDPKSEESKKRRLVFKNLGYDVPEDLSYTDLGDSDVLRSLRSKQMEQPKLVGSTRQGGVSGVGKPKEEKKKKLGTEEAKTLFNIATAYNAITDLQDAVNKNVNKFSLYGDNEYTESAGRFKQGIGRLLSGGAIGEEEAADFLNLIPTTRDNDEITKRKLKKMEQDLTYKFKTLGFNKEDILYPDNEKIIEDSTQTQQNTKIVTDKQTGKRYEVDQEGNVVKEL